MCAREGCDMSLSTPRAVYPPERSENLPGVRIAAAGSAGASYASRVIATVEMSALFGAGIVLGHWMTTCR